MVRTGSTAAPTPNAAHSHATPFSRHAQSLKNTGIHPGCLKALGRIVSNSALQILEYVVLRGRSVFSGCLQGH